MNIIARKKLFFIISGIIIVPGLISLFLFGLPLGIDFSGGSELELSAPKKIDVSAVKSDLLKNKVTVHTLKQLNERTVILKTNVIDQKEKNKIVENLKKTTPGISDKRFETVGPVIGSETKNNAIKAVIVASLVITLFIAFAFREVSRPVSSWKFGVCAIIALLHDVLVVIGIFSILGKLFGIEVDSLFITALLTVMGFSVHDTIVVFDRIRENLKKTGNLPFETVVNNSMLETFNRSLNTSLTVVIVLFTLLLFGGESVRWFIIALLVGIISGTYSSIFNASPLLVAWNEIDRKQSKRS